MIMQNRQLGSGFGIVDIKFLSQMPTETEFKKYGPNEYLLIRSDESIQFIYIDDGNNKKEISIDDIEGLKEALIDLPNVSVEELKEEDKKTVLKTIQSYHLKTHGGNEFIIFKDEKYQGLINEFPKEKIPLINAWINSDEGNKKDITSILDNHTLALIIPDILVDLDVTRLSKILPNIIVNLPIEIKELFSHKEILKKLDKRFINSLKKSLPNDMPTYLDTETLSEFLSKDNIANINPEILAYLIPALLDLMEYEDLEKASVAISKRLATKHFRAIADENYFKLNMETFNDQVTLKNNQRTLAFFANNSQSNAQFRNKKWQLDHTHLHLEGNGEEREYKIYDSRKEFENVKNGVTDPNLDIVGEIHTVYKRTSKRGDLKYMAVGFLLKIGEENPNFEKILSQIENMDKLTEDKKLDIFINYQKMFMPTFRKAQQTNSIFFHSWGSLKSKTPAFKAGLRFNVIPDAIEVSQTQYDRFKQLFGEMAVLTEEKVLEPIERKANHRQLRI